VIPSTWQFALLALAAFRLWKLIGDDRILDRPREWALRQTDDRRGNTKWGDFIVCPWCAGFWISGLTYLGWMLTLGDLPDSGTDVAVALGVWFALSGAVGVIAEAAQTLQDWHD
jgi:hypothetical protein